MIQQAYKNPMNGDALKPDNGRSLRLEF